MICLETQLGIKHAMMNTAILTKLFSSWYIFQRSIYDYQAFRIPLPAYVLVKRGMIEHGAQSKYRGLRGLLVPVGIYDGPITVHTAFSNLHEWGSTCMPLAIPFTLTRYNDKGTCA